MEPCDDVSLKLEDLEHKIELMQRLVNELHLDMRNANFAAYRRGRRAGWRLARFWLQDEKPWQKDGTMPQDPPEDMDEV